MYKVLMTGGSGVIGTQLTPVLQKHGYHVEHIGRSRNSKTGVKTWLYDVKKGSIEDGVFNLEGYEGFYIIHLAGEGIMDKPWTEERKKSIIGSRVNTIKFLYEECLKRKLFPKAVVSAAGIAYYGMVTNDHPFSEEDPASDDFIGQCCVQWENAAKLFESHCPVSCLRTPLVLDANEGGLPMIVKPLQFFGVKTIIGTGKQWLPWVHMYDLCNAYVFALEKQLSGSYNVVAREHVRFSQFMDALTPIRRLKKPRKFRHWIRIKIPVWAVRFLYGSRHKLVTEGTDVLGMKLEKEGFRFHFQEIRDAFEDIYIGRYWTET
ncbi:MAG TPA: TIGR01777 family oxidoreductase [Flavobacteriales bacterium]|nr:TIGR01777 family oxidoreductase [Flavobacteriales bacterium]